jgi:hypothetical protein
VFDGRPSQLCRGLERLLALKAALQFLHSWMVLNGFAHVIHMHKSPNQIGMPCLLAAVVHAPSCLVGCSATAAKLEAQIAAMEKTAAVGKASEKQQSLVATEKGAATKYKKELSGRTSIARKGGLAKQDSQTVDFKVRANLHHTSLKGFYASTSSMDNHLLTILSPLSLSFPAF